MELVVIQPNKERTTENLGHRRKPKEQQKSNTYERTKNVN